MAAGHGSEADLMRAASDDEDAGFAADLDDFDHVGKILSCLIDVFARTRPAAHKDGWGQSSASSDPIFIPVLVLEGAVQGWSQ